jgi:hypothetical protein
MARRVDALGEGDGNQRKIRTAEDITLNGQYPMRDRVISFPDVKHGDTLKDHAQAELKKRRLPIEIPTLVVEVHDGSDPPFGVPGMGDEIRVIADYGYLQLNDYYRVTNHEFRIGNEGEEEVTYRFNQEEEL